MKDRMKILLAYDGSECADAAVDDLNRAGLPGDVRLTVLSVAENWMPSTWGLELLDGIDVPGEFKIMARRAAVRLQQSNPGWEVKTEALSGSPSAVIIKRAESWNPDLVIMGSHGRTALGRFFFGSVSQRV